MARGPVGGALLLWSWWLWLRLLLAEAWNGLEEEKGLSLDLLLLLWWLWLWLLAEDDWKGLAEEKGSVVFLEAPLPPPGII
ncbi:hypothetical protein GGR56DRAFT_654773 [Xylariaceae sp. FL0804]|nr:hypothetical protein GGR56DRAFT_654773 [Xylariaceae sp. FL0804]